MSIAEIETAVRYEVPVVVVICNDNGLGAEVHMLDVFRIPSEIATHTTPSFAAVAQAFGAEGYTVRTEADFAALEERFARPVTGPIVIDCVVNPRVRGDWVEALHSMFARAAASSSGTELVRD